MKGVGGGGLFPPSVCCPHLRWIWHSKYAREILVAVQMAVCVHGLPCVQALFDLIWPPSHNCTLPLLAACSWCGQLAGKLFLQPKQDWAFVGKGVDRPLHVGAWSCQLSTLSSNDCRQSWVVPFPGYHWLLGARREPLLLLWECQYISARLPSGGSYCTYEKPTVYSAWCNLGICHQVWSPSWLWLHSFAGFNMQAARRERERDRESKNKREQEREGEERERRSLT